jgi:trafficking protein particle complex subunit 9
MSVVLPASSFHAVSIIGKPLGTGDLVIRGCTVQAPGGMSREFVLPLSTDEEDDRLSRRRSAMDCEIGRSKYSGLDSRPWERAVQRTSASIIKQKSFRFLECKVVPEQPLLRIRRTSLTHGAVMLYNGEMLAILLFS